MTDTNETVTRQQLAAYRAHRSRLIRSLNNATGAVRKAIRAQIAGYDALLRDLVPATA
jgi:hypothetical protein